MNYTYLHYQIGLTQLCGIGPVTQKRILKSVDDPEIIFHLNPVDLQHITGLSGRIIRQLEREKALEKADKIIDQHSKYDIKTLFISDTNYPDKLSHCPDAPLVLYQKGELSLKDLHKVAIVGTRDATHYGLDITEKIVKSFKNIPLCVVSGLAIGIDTAAHKACLQNDIPTIGVLAHGLDRIYPSENRELAKILSAKGALLTEFPFETNPDRENFPKRNRIVAGLCDATIVVESKTKGGSLITADLANDYNRDVFAVPGNIGQKNSAGCNRLIYEQKAHLLESPKKFLEFMEWDGLTIPARKPLIGLTVLQEMIMNVIQQKQPAAIDIISIRSNIPLNILNAELFHLELKGVIKALPGKKYILQ